MFSKLSLVLLGVLIGASAMFGATYSETFKGMTFRADSQRITEIWRAKCLAMRSKILTEIAEDEPLTSKYGERPSPWTKGDYWTYRISSSTHPIGAFEIAQVCNRASAITLPDIIEAIEKRGVALAERRERAIWRDMKNLMSQQKDQ